MKPRVSVYGYDDKGGVDVRKGIRRREGSSKQIMTPSHDYLCLPLWPPAPITEIRQPVCVSVYFTFSEGNKCVVCVFVCVMLYHTDVFTACYQSPHFLFPTVLSNVQEGCAGALASMTRQLLLIASRIADGHRRKTYFSRQDVERTADWFCEAENDRTFHLSSQDFYSPLWSFKQSSSLLHYHLHPPFLFSLSMAWFLSLSSVLIQCVWSTFPSFAVAGGYGPIG